MHGFLSPPVLFSIRMVDASDESKKEIAAAIVKGVKLSLVGTAAEAIKI